MKHTNEGEEIATPREKPERPSVWKRSIENIKAKRRERQAERDKENSQDRSARVTAAATRRIGWYTLILAAMSFYQFIILRGQLGVMRKDQRPWIRVDLDSPSIQADSAMFGTLHLVNKGKTPARTVRGDIVVERVKNGENPKLDYPRPHMKISEGIQFPDVPSDAIPAMRARQSIGSNSPENDPITKTESEDFANGVTFYVVYGTITYTDFFGVDHWTKFCTPIVSSPPRVSGFTFRACTDYGDVDSN